MAYDEMDSVLLGSRTGKLEQEIRSLRGAMDSNALTAGLLRIEEAINTLQDKGMPVDNLDEVKKHLRDEFSMFVKQLTLSIRDAVAKVSYEIKIPENIKIDNYQELAKTLKNLERTMNNKEWSPKIDVSVPDVIVPDIKVPDINVPPVIFPEQKAPIVNIDVEALLKALQPLKLLSNKATSPVSVRISDGAKFVKALKEVAQATEKQVYAFSNSAGISKDDYKEAEKELYRTTTASNTSATVGVASSSIVSARNRISVVLTNDSDSTIYIAKGGTAELNKGIRLNANGGSISIEDWNGAISAISAGASKNICICEAY